MSASVLVRGALFRAPEGRTSSGGRPLVRATIKAQSATDNNAVDYWNLLVFSESTREQLMELRDGDHHLAVQGPLKLEIFNGKLQRTVFVDQVLALRTKKKRKEKPEPSRPDPKATMETDLDDPIPF
jgi:hypothetical protein